MKKTVFELDVFLDLLPDAVIIVNFEGRIVFANASILGLLGYSPDELVEKPLDCLIPEPFRAEHQSQFERFQRHGKPIMMGKRTLLQGLDKSGNEIPLSITVANINLDDEKYSIAILRDISQLHSEITEITFRAETDALTGLSNRSQLSQFLAAAIDKSCPFSLLFMDLEKFKSINDEHGHEVGDKVLQIVAKRLLSLIRPQDLAVRIGGDEFVIFLDGLVDTRAIKKRATAIAASIKRPFHLEGFSGAVGVNIGGAQYPRDGNSERALLQVADQNMYSAKKSGVAYKGRD